MFLNRARASRRIAAIAKAVGRSQHQQLDADADELVGDMKRRAPHEDGDLQASIRKEDASTPARAARKVLAGGEKTIKPVRKSEKGNAPTYDYALAQEFGTEDMEANPFFYPSWRSKRRRFKARRTAAAKKAVADAAKAP